MPKQKPSLPPEIGSWLASDKPELREKAEAALRAAETDANDLLFAQVEKEQQNVLFMYVLTLCLLQLPFQFATRHMAVVTVSRICLGILIAAPFFYVGLRFLLSPAGSRLNGVSSALARRGDVRALPYIVKIWQPRFNNETSFEIDSALLIVLQNAVPGTVSFSRERSTKDGFSLLRAQFSALLIKRKGEFWFRSAFLATPEKVQIWLALLSHLTFDPSAKSRIIIQRIANARALTLDEEVLQNAARAFIYGAPGKAVQEPASVEAVAPTPNATWKPAEISEASTVLQRLGRH